MDASGKSASVKKSKPVRRGGCLDADGSSKSCISSSSSSMGGVDSGAGGGSVSPSLSHESAASSGGSDKGVRYQVLESDKGLFSAKVKVEGTHPESKRRKLAVRQKLDDLEMFIANFYKDVCHRMGDIRHIDLTMWGFQVLGAGLKQFVSSGDDDSEGVSEGRVDAGSYKQLEDEVGAEYDDDMCSGTEPGRDCNGSVSYDQMSTSTGSKDCSCSDSEELGGGRKGKRPRGDMSFDGSEQSSDDPDFECGSSAGSSSSSSSLDIQECHDEDSDCEIPNKRCGTNNKQGSPSSSCSDGSSSDGSSVKESMTVGGIRLESESPSAGSSVQGLRSPVKSRADPKKHRTVIPRGKDLPSSPSGSSSSDG